MHVFDADELVYRFEIQELDGKYRQRWEIPVPKAKLKIASGSVSDFEFEGKGTIYWYGDHPKRRVQFRVNGIEVFDTSISAEVGAGLTEKVD